MQLRRLRLSGLPAILLISGTLGALAGYLFGHTILVRSAKAKLSSYAAELVKHADGYAGEIDEVFNAALATKFPACSDEDLMRMRGFAFRSQVVKDVGRVHDGKLYCSGTLGRLAEPWSMPPVDFTTPYGKKVHANVPLTIGDGQHATIIELFDVDVVLGPNAFDGWGHPPMQYMVAIVNQKKHQVARAFGAQLAVGPEWILSQRSGTWGGTSYRARCSETFALCVVTAIASADVSRINADLLVGYTVLGAAAGFGIGLGITLLHRRHSSLIKQLRRAIRLDALHVVYQPVIDLTTRRVAGAEALVRWTNDRHIPVPADAFISIAEQGGFIGEITSLVLRHVIRDLGDLLRDSPDFRVNINIAAADLASPEFLNQIEQLMRENLIPPQRVGLELTERSAANHAVAQRAIRDLRALGHRIYIDDFGTGYSTLAYLHELEVDAIKIDRSFTRTIQTGAVTATILPQILSMAAALDLAVTVEGVENADQAKYLESTGRRLFAQGWYFGYPVPPEALRSLLDHDAGAWQHDRVETMH